MPGKAIAIRHLAFEDLGLLESILLMNGYGVSYREAGLDDLSRIRRENPDILVILGAPLSVNDVRDYPFLEEEIRLVRDLEQSGTAILGICLGAQVIARAWGAEIAPMLGTEIGFSSLSLTREGLDSVLSPLAGEGEVLHWHGEACAPVSGAPSLATTGVCDNQAFQPATHVLGLQFHLEVRPDRFERWLIGHCAEIRATGLDVLALREQGRTCLPGLEAAAGEVFQGWLDQAAR